MHCRRHQELTGGPRGGCSAGTSEKVAVKIPFHTVAANEFEFAQTVSKKRRQHVHHVVAAVRTFSVLIYPLIGFPFTPSRGYKASDTEGSTSVIDLKLVDII